MSNNTIHSSRIRSAVYTAQKLLAVGGMFWWLSWWSSWLPGNTVDYPWNHQASPPSAFTQNSNTCVTMHWGQRELCALWVVGLREGGIEGGESSSKAICSCVITALGLSWLWLNPGPPDQPIAWLRGKCWLSLLHCRLHGFKPGASCWIPI